MESMQALIERADAFMRHCVAGVTKSGKDKQAAFAICKAGGNKAGYYQPGTKNKTAKGKRAIRAHGRDAAAKSKDAAYERAIKSEGTMTSMRALIERLEEGAKGGPGPADIEQVGEIKIKTRPAPRGRGLADSWQVTAILAVDGVEYEMRSMWYDGAYAKADGKRLVSAMRTALSQLLRTGASAIVAVDKATGHSVGAGADPKTTAYVVQP
jgi:hypothetical protein